jgi:hypothetical protein
MPADATASIVCGISLRLTLLTSADGHSPARTAAAAVCTTTWPEEQAVSRETHGPCSPSAKERRPHAMEMVSPVMV